MGAGSGFGLTMNIPGATAGATGGAGALLGAIGGPLGLLGAPIISDLLSGGYGWKSDPNLNLDPSGKGTWGPVNGFKGSTVGLPDGYNIDPRTGVATWQGGGQAPGGLNSIQVGDAQNPTGFKGLADQYNQYISSGGKQGTGILDYAKKALGLGSPGGSNNMASGGFDWGSLIGQIGGKVLGGVFGPQGQNQVQTTGQNISQTGGQTGVTQTSQNNLTQTAGSQTPTESPYMSLFRQSLIGPYQQLLTKAQQPTYGTAQQAQYLNDVNANTNAAIKSLQNKVGMTGGDVGGSGAFGAGVSSLLQGRDASLANYAMQVPLLNQQAALQNTSNVLGLGMNFAGHAPLGFTSTGETQGGSYGTTNQSLADFMNRTGTGNTTNVAPPWWSRLLGAAGGLQMPGSGGGVGGPGMIPFPGDPNAPINLPGYGGYNPTFPPAPTPGYGG